MRDRRVFAAIALAVVTLATSAPAWADSGSTPSTGPGSYPPPGPTASPSVAPTTEVKGEKVVKTPTSSSLPFTGAEIFAMSVGGTALIAGGTAFVVIGRRRRRAANS